MQKMEFEFPEPKDDEITIEPSNMEEIQEKPPSVKAQPEPEPEPEPEVVSADDEVEVVDDTPEADRGRKPGEPVEELTDAEMGEYSDKVQKRFKKLSRGYHDERRAKEAAIREAEEARRYAEQMLSENKRLQQDQGQNRQAMFLQAKKAVETENIAAEEAYRKAYEEGNAENLLAAQKRLNEAQFRQKQIDNIEARMPLQQEGTEVQQQVTHQEPPQEAPPQQPRDSKAEAWKEKNTWFGAPGRDQMTALALGYHTELVNSGVDPTSDEYYGRLDTRMREVFPSEFDDDDGDTQNEEVAQPETHSSVVAPATRSVAPKRMRLTETQVKLARKLGVPLKEYAKQVAKLEMGDS